MYLLLPTLMVTANSPTEIPMAGHSTYPTKASKMARRIDKILDKELGSFVKKRSADLPNIHSLSGGFYGIIDKLILNQVIENFRINSYNNSLDVKDFDISFAKGLSLENGCATITKFTAYLISKGIEYAKNFNIEKTPCV